MAEFFTRFEAADILGIARHRLRDWQERHYIIPTVQESDGRGTKNLFSREDLYWIRMFEYMVGQGIACGRSAEYVVVGLHTIFGHGIVELKERGFIAFVKDGETFSAYIINNDERCSLNDSIDHAFVLNVGKLIAWVDAAVSKYRS